VGEHVADECGAVEDLLEVVEHEEHRSVGEVGGEVLGRVDSGLGGGDAERLEHFRRDEVGVGDRGELDEVDPVGVGVGDLGGEVERQPGLAHAAGAGEGEQSVAIEQLASHPQDVLAPHEGAEICREVVGDRFQGSQGGKLRRQARDDELGELHLVGEVLQGVQSGVAQRDPVGQSVAHQPGRRPR
jgi:hypothetical protein